MHASTPLILRKSRMRKRARTDLCGGRSVMVVPTATVIPVQKSGWGKRGFIEACLWAPDSAAVLARWARWKPPVRNSESTGTAIYMGCTRQAQLEPISTAVFERMTAATGGKAYFAKTWKAEQQAFASIRDDLAHLYSLSYYPRPNPNRGWRRITVKLTSERMKKCHVRTRNGYRLQVSQFSKVQGAMTASPN